MLRRTFLVGTAALPAAGLAAKVAIAMPTETVVALPPLPAYPFKWWFSYDGETYIDECDTKEQALRLLSSYGEGLIAECQRQDYDLSIDGGEIIEMLYGKNEERIGEGEFLEDVTSEQENDLGKMVSETIELWIRKHKIDTSAWSFGVVRNHVKFNPESFPL